jgi:glutathione S-transferase
MARPLLTHPKNTERTMPSAKLTISSKNYSSWCLRGWLMAKLSGIDFEEIAVDLDDVSARAEILLLSPSILVPTLDYDGVKIWDTLAIGEFLNEIAPAAGLLPADRMRRAHCRSINGEIHSGFTALRSALPMNLRGHFPGFKVWSKAQGDIVRVTQIWRECLSAYGGPYLFGKISIADAMYAPVATRFRSYDVPLDAVARAYCDQIFEWPAMQEWIAQAMLEEEAIEELEVEF